MNLVRELFRGRRVTDPKRPRSAPGSPSVISNRPKEQIADNIERYLARRTEFGIVFSHAAACMPGPADKGENTVALTSR